MHAIATRFDDYWDKLRGTKKIPDFLDFKISEVPTDITPFLSLMQVEQKPRRYRYSLAGTSVTKSYGEDLSGKYIDEIDLGDRLEMYLKDFDTAVDEKKIIRRIDSYTKEDGHIYSFDGHLYPFLGVEGDVTRMIILSIDSRDVGPKDIVPMESTLG